MLLLQNSKVTDRMAVEIESILVANVPYDEKSYLKIYLALEYGLASSD